MSGLLEEVVTNAHGRGTAFNNEESDYLRIVRSIS